MPIKISKAIEILTREVHNINLSPDLDMPDVLKLSINTMKYYQELKKLGIINPNWVFPGEEPEEQ